MAGGNKERKHGKRRHTYHVERMAGQLTARRQEILGVDWTDKQEELTRQLGEMVVVGAEMIGRSTRMDRDGASRRAACERIISQTMTDQMVNIQVEAH